MPKIYLSEGWYPMVNFSEERNWESDKEVEVTQEELDKLKEQDKVIDKQQEFLNKKWDD